MKTEPTELGIVSTKNIQGYFNLFVAAPLPCVYLLPILGHSNGNTHQLSFDHYYPDGPKLVDLAT